MRGVQPLFRAARSTPTESSSGLRGVTTMASRTHARPVDLLPRGSPGLTPVAWKADHQSEVRSPVRAEFTVEAGEHRACCVERHVAAFVAANGRKGLLRGGCARRPIMLQCWLFSRSVLVQIRKGRRERGESRSGFQASCIPMVLNLGADERGSCQTLGETRSRLFGSSRPCFKRTANRSDTRRSKHSTPSPFDGGMKRGNTIARRSATTGAMSSASPFSSRLKGRTGTGTAFRWRQTRGAPRAGGTSLLAARRVRGVTSFDSQPWP